jgi:hypothetical protein
MNKFLLILLAGPLFLMGCAEQRGLTEPKDTAEVVNEQALLNNEANERTLTTLVAEIEPYVRFHDDGTWSVDPAASLSPAAAEFAREAQRSSAALLDHGVQLSRAPSSGPSSPAYAVFSSWNHQGLTRFWWGYRVSLRSATAQEIYSAWWRSSVSSAIKAFLRHFGYSGWAVGAAGTLVPAYAWTIGYVDRVGGYRGVHMNVPWSIVPTYIAPQ